MIEDTIAKIEQRLRSARDLPISERQELERLLLQLRTEANTLPALRGSGNGPIETDDPDDANTALSRLQESVAEFETTHPHLIGTVNRISTILANMGI